MKSKTLLKAALRKWYYIRNIDQDDVILASFPKSGNTWVAFMIANLYRDAYRIPLEVNFFTLPGFLPETTAPWGRIPRKNANYIRVIKTHDHYVRQFRRILWLVRDPRKVMRSYYLYSLGMGLADKSMSYRDFVLSDSSGINSWMAHSASYLDLAVHNRGVQLLRYEDLLENPLQMLTRIARFLGLVDPGIDLAAVVKRCDREAMRELEYSTRKSGVIVEKDYDFVGRKRTVEAEEEVDALIVNRASSLMRQLRYLD